MNWFTLQTICAKLGKFRFFFNIIHHEVAVLFQASFIYRSPNDFSSTETRVWSKIFLFCFRCLGLEQLMKLILVAASRRKSCRRSGCQNVIDLSRIEFLRNFSQIFMLLRTFRNKFRLCNICWRFFQIPSIRATFRYLNKGSKYIERLQRHAVGKVKNTKNFPMLNVPDI